MAKKKVSYICSECGSVSQTWSGQCFHCQSWNTLQEEVQVNEANTSRYKSGYAVATSKPTALNEVQAQEVERIKTGCGEFDNVLGSGLVAGSVILLGGDPGIGKSTLLLNIGCNLTQSQPVLYVTGEESLEQIAIRAQRSDNHNSKMIMLAETNVEKIIAAAESIKPKVIMIDSIQTLYCAELSAIAGSVSQVRECALRLVQFAKTNGTSIFFIGHVTKEGQLAGPRVLEHMVDTVLYFEGEPGSKFRVVRARKNRFGAINELAMYAMCDKGLKPVTNRSAMFYHIMTQMLQVVPLLLPGKALGPFWLKCKLWLMSQCILPED